MAGQDMSGVGRTATMGAASFTVRLPSACLLPSFGDPEAPCHWRIERQGDVVWCSRHGGVDAVDHDEYGSTP